MEYEDRIVIPTPEGVQIDYVLAGLGSRFAAALVDGLLRGVVLAALGVVLVVIGDPTIAVVVFAIGVFAALFVYDVAFEVWAAGRTPGKRWNALRVVRSGGEPVTLAPSAVRNLLRIVDLPLTLFLGGAIAIIVTKRNQRFGDLAADTIVIREPGGSAWEVPGMEPAPTYATGAPQLDLTGVSAAELAAVRDFLARRAGLTSVARTRVAQTLAEAIAPKVGGLPPDARTPEWILETIGAAGRSR
ncbi:MAG: hypothetical protein QOJ25_781 [Solirubrobacteraceae bacterium]|jgi:uncharacterized RDD family membrane protein YckC|nr:hypothetical protein [Solirubrobacteraceae bacterium]